MKDNPLRWETAMQAQKFRSAKIKHSMKIAIGADHAGFEMKNQLRETLRAAGHEVRDFGTDSAESTDYPDYAAAVGRAVAAGQVDRGVLVCGSGVGMSIAANKVAGVRAALGVTPEWVAATRQHNDANVLALGARFIDVATARSLLDTFLGTSFEAGRHSRRVQKIAQIEGGS
jgi:ribose 5-phosphate isomerase B